MLWRRAILGVLAFVPAILLVQQVSVSASAEDEAETPANSESQAESGAKAQVEAPGESPSDEKMDEIPLSEVWAWKMPGTRQFISRHDETVDKLPSTEDFFSSLVHISRHEKLPPAFAVSGRGIDALNKAYEILSKQEKMTNDFTPEDDLSMIFFGVGRHEQIHLERVERQPRKVLVYYKLVPHLIGPQTSYHFAVIPLGKLPEGETKIEVIRSSYEPIKESPNYNPPPLELESQMISTAFQITVNSREQLDEEPERSKR